MSSSGSPIDGFLTPVIFLSINEVAEEDHFNEELAQKTVFRLRRLQFQSQESQFQQQESQFQRQESQFHPQENVDRAVKVAGLGMHTMFEDIYHYVKDLMATFKNNTLHLLGRI